MAVYALPRMTRDLDLVVECGPADVEKITELFEADCYVDEDDVRDAVTHTGIFNVIHNDWIIKADFIVRKNTSTGENTDARFRRMMMSKSPSRRVSIACQMFSTGVALVRAGLLGQAHDTGLALRKRIFLRLYGADFSPAERARILKKWGTP